MGSPVSCPGFSQATVLVANLEWRQIVFQQPLAVTQKPINTKVTKGTKKDKN